MKQNHKLTYLPIYNNKMIIVLVSSIFAISFVRQQALAQGNQTGEHLLALIRLAVTQLVAAAGQQLVVPQLALAAALLIG
jgi:hypothetical protein